MKQLFLILGFICVMMDSQAQTPVLVQEIYPGNNSNTSDPNLAIFNPITWNGRLYFYGNDSIHGLELWSYDEISPAAMVADINQGIGGILPGLTGPPMAIFRNRLFFAADVPGFYTLYAYDGINPPARAPGFSSNHLFSGSVFDLTVAGNNLYFFSTDYSTGQNVLFRYDGTNPPVVVPVPTTRTAGSNPLYLTVFNGKLYFSAATGNNTRKLHVLDPATNKVSVFTSAAYPSGLDNTSSMVAGGSNLYFIGEMDTTGAELYSYDGTTARRLTDVAPGVKDGAGRPLVYFNEHIYFSGSFDGLNYQLYSFDEQTKSGIRVFNINPGGNAHISDMIVYKNKIYLTATTPATGIELWRFNGIAGSLVADIKPGKGSSGMNTPGGGNNNLFAILNGHLYFAADDGVHGHELWRLDDPTGIKDASWSGQVLLYPNPAGNSATLSVTLQGTQSLGISLSDMAGQVVFTTGLQSWSPGKHHVSIPLQNLVAGQYFYRIIGADSRMVASGAVVKK